MAVGLPGALLAVVVVAVAYAKLEPAVTYLIYRVAASGLAAVAVGLIAMGAARFARVRSPVLASALGAVIAAVAIYAMWVTYVHDHLNRLRALVTYGALVAHPDVLVRLIRFFNAVGTWKLRSGEVMRGLPLTVFWAGEASMILLCGVLFPIKAVVPADEIDCRECGAGGRLVRPILRFGMGARDELITAVEGREFTRLVNFDAPGTEDEPQLSVRLICCPKCGQTNVVTVNRIAFELTREGRKLVIQPVVDRLMVTAEEAEELKGLLKVVAGRQEARGVDQAGEEQPAGDEGEGDAAEEVTE
jgi:hypothetical protein